MYSIFEKLCDKRNVTAYKVCQAIGEKSATISNWKAGRYTPKQDKMQKIADYFGVTTDYMYGKTLFVKCPICDCTYNPLENDEYHDMFHKRCLKATDDFGYIGHLSQLKEKSKVTFRLICLENNMDKVSDLADKYMEYMFLIWLWENDFNYSYTSDLRYRWKQEYIEQNMYPSNDLSLEKCNHIRMLFFTEPLEDGNAQKTDVFDKMCNDKEFWDYINRLWELPPDSKQSIYAQIRFQENEIAQN